MEENPYQPPEIPADPPPGGSKRRRSPYGYAQGVVIAALLGGILLDSPSMPFSHDGATLGLCVGALLGAAVYHFASAPSSP